MKREGYLGFKAFGLGNCGRGVLEAKLDVPEDVLGISSDCYGVSF